MAQVTQDIEADVNWLLGYLDRRWRAIPKVAEEWDTWDPIDQEVFVLEWAIPRSHLVQLEEYVARGQLSPTQRTRYKALQLLMADNRPVLEQLLNE